MRLKTYITLTVLELLKKSLGRFWVYEGIFGA